MRDDEVPRFMGAKKMSLHQTGFQEVLSAADLLGRYPSRLALIGCQPQDLEDWGGPLTAPVRAELDAAVEMARSRARRLGRDLPPRDAAATPRRCSATTSILQITNSAPRRRRLREDEMT